MAKSKALTIVGLVLLLGGEAYCEPLRVVLGGTSGLPSLRDRNATSRIRSHADTGFYIHYSATDPAKFGTTLRKIAGLFRGHGSIAEVSLGGGFNPQFWTTAWRTNVLAYGFSPDRVVVNVSIAPVDAAEAVPAREIEDFKAFSAAARAHTMVKFFAPVISPNQSGGAGPSGDATTIAIAHPWDSAWWDGARVLAETGGGVALDAPPAFFFRGLPTATQQQAYQHFEESVLRWARSKGLWTAAIVSPYFDGVTFAKDSEAFRAALERADAQPDTWVVENYNECGDPYTRACGRDDAAYLAPVGSEKTPNTIASVALFFTRYTNGLR